MSKKEEILNNLQEWTLIAGKWKNFQQDKEFELPEEEAKEIKKKIIELIDKFPHKWYFSRSSAGEIAGVGSYEGGFYYKPSFSEEEWWEISKNILADFTTTEKAIFLSPRDARSLIRDSSSLDLSSILKIGGVVILVLIIILALLYVWEKFRNFL